MAGGWGTPSQAAQKLCLSVRFVHMMGQKKKNMTDLHPIDADADDPGTDELTGPLVVGNSRHGVLQGMKESWIMTGVFCFASKALRSDSKDRTSQYSTPQKFRFQDKYQLTLSPMYQ